MLHRAIFGLWGSTAALSGAYQLHQIVLDVLHFNCKNVGIWRPTERSAPTWNRVDREWTLTGSLCSETDLSYQLRASFKSSFFVYALPARAIALKDSSVWKWVKNINFAPLKICKWHREIKIQRYSKVSDKITYTLLPIVFCCSRQQKTESTVE